MNLRTGFALTMMVLCLSCMNTRVQLDSAWNRNSKPSYEDYFDSYWWGFYRQPEVSISQVCMDQKPLGFQRLKSFEDAILTGITLGIYAPTTVRVWCGD